MSNYYHKKNNYKESIPKKKQWTNTKTRANILMALTLQGAIEKNPILLLIVSKKVFHILGAPILF